MEVREKSEMLAQFKYLQLLQYNISGDSWPISCCFLISSPINQD